MNNNSSDYLDRLRNIRQKYGCSQPKNHSGIIDQHIPIDRTLGLDKQNTSYYKADLYTIQKMKVGDQSNSSFMPTKNIDYGLRPQISSGLNTQSYSAFGDTSKRVQRQRQIEQIRQNYAASRRKVIEDFSAKGCPRDYSKQIPREYSRQYTKDYLKGDRDYGKEYSKFRKDDYKQPSMVLTTATKIDLLAHNTDQSVSPIKRMSEYEDKKSYRYKQTDNHDTFWRERQARLSQLTSNRLNENKRTITPQEDKITDKLYQVKRSGLYSDPMKSYNHEPQGARLDLENRPGGDYSVNNIERIQQRIQSILGKK